MVSKQVNFVCALVMSAVVCAFASVASAASIGSVTVASVGAGEPATVTASVSGATGPVYLVYRVAEGTAGYQSTWNTNEMACTSGTTYTSSLPALAGAVTLNWYVEADGARSATKNTTLTALPDYNRYHDGVKWARSRPYGWSASIQSNYYADAPNGSQWKASGVGVATAYAGGREYVNTSIGMAYPTLYFLNLPPSAQPYIRSPRLDGGVGMIDFRTKLTGTKPGTSIKVQYATVADEPVESDWQDLPNQAGVFEYTGKETPTPWSRIVHISLEGYAFKFDVRYIRILRTGYNYSAPNDQESCGLGIDNLSFTKPAADVRITEKLKNPGWPAADQDIRMRCAVENVREETPAINRRVSVKYQYVARADGTPSRYVGWQSADMAYMGKDKDGLDWYEGLIPTQKVGYIWYYYQVDYDGYNYGTNPTTGVSDSLGPAYWDAGEDTHKPPTAGTSFEVRPFRSRYGRVKFDAQPADCTIEAMTLVGDEQWQCVTLVDGVKAVTNKFVGYQYYADDADDYEAEPTIWSENNPDSLSDPTIAGNLESSRWLGTEGITNSLVALNEKDYTGFYLYRFSSNDAATNLVNEGEDKRYDYIVKKAVWQDFDEWTASPNLFENSLGGLPTLTFAENFDGNAASAASGAICTTDPWYVDEYADADLKRENFDDEEVGDNSAYQKSETTTTYFFQHMGSRIIKDRGIDTDKNPNVNQTLGLELGGRFENTSDSMPYGLEKITFKARASIDDQKFVLYKNATQQGLPFYAQATATLTERAPSKHYLAFVFLYEADLGLNAFWYEVRLIQSDSANANDETLAAELWRHDKNGTYKRVDGTNLKTRTGLTFRNSLVFNFAVNKDGSNKVTVKINVNESGKNPESTTHFTLTDSEAYGTNKGTFGFGVFDALPSITAFKVASTFDKLSNPDILTSISATASDWDKNLDLWTVDKSISRQQPSETIEIYAADCQGGEYTAKSTVVSKIPGASGTINVKSLTPTDVTVDFKAWNKKFAQIRYTAGRGGVVLDDIWYYPWRSVTRHAENDATVNNVSYLDWTSKEQQEDWLDSSIGQDRSMRDRWAVLEGWTTRSTGGSLIGANLVRTRANTNLVQGIVSPVLENGIGSMSFSYKVTGGKVVYGVERSDEGRYHNWTPVAVFCDNAGAESERYVKVGEYFDGRLRVRVYGQEDIDELENKEEILQGDGKTCGYTSDMGFTDPNAAIFIDNLKVKDYPKDTRGNAWNAYNLLVTGDASAIVSSSALQEGLIYNNQGKSCVFDNTQTPYGENGETFLDDDPYLESPPLTGVGIGEIAFQYRLVPNSGTGDGNIIIKVAPKRGDAADWTLLTNVTVSAASGTAFVKFDNEKIFDENNYVVRFYNSTTEGAPKFILDNVLITAPARASFEFEYVKLLPEQPLVGSNVVVEAKIMREILAPKNIRVFCSYHTYQQGEPWGYKNWFNPKTSPRIELSSVGNKIYRSVGGASIPAGNVDDVVEYILWGTHADIDIGRGDTPIVQSEDTFECPEWYETFDMAASKTVKMDMNEDKALEGWSPYYWVFSCAPGAFFVNEINNWRTRSADSGAMEYIEFAAPAGTDISGWRFIVSNEEAAPADGDNGVFSIVPAAGSRVGRKDEKGWGFMVWGDEWMKDTHPVDFYFNGSISGSESGVTSSAEPQTENLATYGSVLVYRSNGMIVDKVAFGTASFISTLVEDYGFRNAGRKESSTLYPLSMVSKEDDDGETVVGKTVDDFRWLSISGTPGAVNGIGQVMADISGGPVIVELKDPEGNPITDKDILAWIEQYGAKQADIDELTMAEFNEDFLLNLDLTKDCGAELKLTGIEIAEGVVYLRVQLVRTEDDAQVTEVRPINGVLRILGAADLQSDFAVIEDAVIGDEKFEMGSSGITDAEIELPASNPPAFFKATIIAE